MQFNLSHKEKSEYLVFILKTLDNKLCKIINVVLKPFKNKIEI